MEKSDLIASWPLDDGAGTAAKELVSGKSDPIAYVFNHARFKPPSDPIWREEGLLFDGYSTWITRSAQAVSQPSSALTISAWIAPGLSTADWKEGSPQLSISIIGKGNRATASGSTGVDDGVCSWGWQTSGWKLG